MRAFEALIRSRLAGGLPGVGGQLTLSPRPRRGWRPDQDPGEARIAAALMLWYPYQGEPHLLLTVRDGGLPQHAGQVSLPGGALEPGESIEDAAVREATEEVGVDARSIRILGSLSPLHVPVSDFVIHPRCAVAEVRPEFRPRSGEVERILEAPLSVLRDPSTLGVQRRVEPGRSALVPYFEIDGERLWGATAMIVAEFLALIGAPPDPWAAAGER